MSINPNQIIKYISGNSLSNGQYTLLAFPMQLALSISNGNTIGTISRGINANNNGCFFGQTKVAPGGTIVNSYLIYINSGYTAPNASSPGAWVVVTSPEDPRTSSSVTPTVAVDENGYPLETYDVTGTQHTVAPTLAYNDPTNSTGFNIPALLQDNNINALNSDAYYVRSIGVIESTLNNTIKQTASQILITAQKSFSQNNR